MKNEYQSIYQRLSEQYPEDSFEMIWKYYIGLSTYDSNLDIEQTYISVFMMDWLEKDKTLPKDPLLNAFFDEETNRLIKKYGKEEIEIGERKR